MAAAHTAVESGCASFVRGGDRTYCYTKLYKDVKNDTLLHGECVVNLSV